MLPTLETLSEALGGLDGRRILLRADFNVPLDADGAIADDFRIKAAVPTIRWLTGQGAAVVACSHLGRPDGTPDPRYTMAPVQARLGELASGVELLENLRFDPGETGNHDRLVQQLVDGCHGYVNDAFGASHRAHASIVGPPGYLPSAAGRLLAKEAEVLLGLRAKPKRPFVAVLGGAKVSDKLGVIDALLETADEVVIGGGMCFTFLAALGHSVGDSLLQPDQIEACGRLLQSGAPIRLPSDITALAPGSMWCRPGWTCGLTGEDWISDRAPQPSSATSLPRPALCCGTVPWGCSKTRDSRPEPKWWPRRWPTVERSPSSGEATAPPRFASSVWTGKWTTYPPAAAHRWS